MRGAGFLAIWSDVERSNLTDYRHWLTREHTTERVTTEGFLANRVFRAVRSDILGPGSRRSGSQAGAPLSGSDQGAARSYLHSEAPLRRRMDRDREVDRGTGLPDHRHGAAHTGGEIPALRLIR